MRDERGTASTSPIEEFLIDLHQRVSDVGGGKIADYIPELGKADADTFGMALATVDGETYATGDADHLFTIQSVSKPFMYGHALQHYGRDYVLRHVGVEPTGEAFNSIVLDEVANRPFNPMVNAGAIAVAALMPGDTARRAHCAPCSICSPISPAAGSKSTSRCSNPRTPAATATGPSPI